MLFNFYPWEIDIDIEATKDLYMKRNYAKDSQVNKNIFNTMSEKQKAFFASIGVDILKVKAQEKVYDIDDDDELSEGKIYSMSLDFLMCGSLLSIPDYQEKIYSDEEIFGMNLPDSLKVIKMSEEEKLPIYDIDGWGCVFKHPFFRFEEEEFRKWDCGYILGTILLIKDL
ncbi:toxin-antitoxin system protein [Terrisporobacter sp.]|uniref:toxin-antitoxin system protein n=1 Tax=Terrisporobacter sp. TaxID=1965305 RepID=UPI0026285FDE|nr:toxin-antitoxin system protein [Terrisporobacter sp.]